MTAAVKPVEDIEPYLGLVRREAWRLTRRAQSLRIEHDELLSVGTIALAKAAEHFDPSRGFQFTTYAVPKIRGAMLDELSNHCVLSRPARRNLAATMRAREVVTQASGRPATLRDAAAHLNVSPSRFDRWESRMAETLPAQLDDVSGDGRHPFRDTLAGSDDPSAEINHEQEVAALRDALLSLTRKERETLERHYLRGMTAVAIAREDGVSEAAVSYRRKRALRKMRQQLRSLRD